MHCDVKHQPKDLHWEEQLGSLCTDVPSSLRKKIGRNFMQIYSGTYDYRRRFTDVPSPDFFLREEGTSVHMLQWGRVCEFRSIRRYNVGRDPFNQNSDRSDRGKRATSKGGPVFSKLFRLDRTDPLSFGPKFPEMLVEWIAPVVSIRMVFLQFFWKRHRRSF